MIIKLDKGDCFRKLITSHCTIIKMNGIRIKITWGSFCKLIDYRLMDEVKSNDEYDRFVINNHYEIELEVIR